MLFTMKIKKKNFFRYPIFLNHQVSVQSINEKKIVIVDDRLITKKKKKKKKKILKN